MSTPDPDRPSSESNLASLAAETRKHSALLKKIADKSQSKDIWDKLPAITGIVSSVLLAAVGMYVTHAYKTRDERNQKAKELSEQAYRDQRDREEAKKHEREDKLRESELVTSLMPFLTGENQQAKKGALQLLKRLGDTELMTQLATLDDTPASREVLLDASTSSETSKADRTVVKRALATLEASSLDWFLSSFAGEIDRVFGKSMFPKELVAAIAYQETGYIWSSLAKRGMDKKDVLKVCAGDTVDAPIRGSWPKNKADLLKDPNGAAVFAIARQALEDSTALQLSVGGSISRSPDKFFRSFGPFAYDLQFFKSDPDFFLQRKWQDFNECATRLLAELNAAVKRQNWTDRKSLTADDMVHVAIAYTRGKSDVSQGFKQGIKDDDGKFYGERIHDLIQTARGLGSKP